MNSGDIIDAFPQVQKWTTNMIDSISQDSIGPISTAACVQFSGFSNLGRVESGRSLVVKVYSSSKLDGKAENGGSFDGMCMANKKVAFYLYGTSTFGDRPFFEQTNCPRPPTYPCSQCAPSFRRIDDFLSLPSTFNSTLYF